MREMARHFFADNPYLIFPLFTLVLFVLTFVGVLIWVSKRDLGGIERLERLPFEGEGR